MVEKNNQVKLILKFLQVNHCWKIKKERQNGEKTKKTEDDERRSCCVILNIKTDMLIWYSIQHNTTDIRSKIKKITKKKKKKKKNTKLI